MALQLAEQDGKLESVYQSLVTQDPAADTGSAMDDEHPKGALARTGAGLAVALLLITFFVTFILPTFEKMFDEFGITLPTMLLLLISSATGIRVIAIFLFLLVVFLYLFSPVWKRLTSTTNSQGTQFDSPKTKLLSLLALGVQSPQGIETSIDVLAKNHPVESIRRQLGRAHTRITHGEDVMTALHSAKVLNSSESLALQMTASSSARAWLMQWFASRRQRRTRFWNSVIVKSISTVSTVFLGVIVAWTAIGVMMALYSMISDLA
jgi:type II secretory pathway component PulF